MIFPATSSNQWDVHGISQPDQPAIFDDLTVSNFRRIVRWESKLQNPGDRGFQEDHSTGQQDALGEGRTPGSDRDRGRGRHPKKWEDEPRIHGISWDQQSAKLDGTGVNSDST